MINIIAFMGPSASGKTTLRESMGLDRIVTFTSRKPRKGRLTVSITISFPGK